MSGFCWNVRGLNKSSKHSAIRQWLQNNTFEFGSFLETRVKENKALNISSIIANGWSFVSNYEYHRGGRIWVLWKDNVRVTPVFKSSQMITVSVLLEGKEEEFLCSFVYASNNVEERKDLWTDLRAHYDSPMFRRNPWIVAGDFNVTLDIEEHSNYLDNPMITLSMRDFQEVASYCSLVDSGGHGPKFTWSNKRQEGIICKKLDRLLVNDIWLDFFPSSCGIFESGGCSDHLRGRFALDAAGPVKRKPFKFMNVLASLPQFASTVDEAWSSTDELFVSTSAMFRFSKKLKSLKPILRSLGKEKLGDLPKRTKAALNDLCFKQEQTLLDPSQTRMEEEDQAYRKWTHLSELEERFLKQRAKLHWLSVGDKNNAYFHRSAQIRQMQNSIREVIGLNDEVLTKPDEIKKEAERFFKEFLTHSPSDYKGMTEHELGDLLDFRCSDIEQEHLTKEVTNEEIRKVLFSMPKDKSPGPDGYTCEFFKSAWSIVGADFLVAIRSFFEKEFLPKGVNSTILALIPKRTDAKAMKDYRPISCCNVLYKVILKIIANRLKGLLPKFIEWNQSAFVQDRLLMENVLLATELVKDYHKDSVSPRCAMKIDISKAFDSVQWDFVLNTLAALKFPARFIHWIRLCITTASFSIQVNGALTGYFQSQRGLRQGCALSPYLFVICMNVLSRMLDKAASERRICYHPNCKDIRITHLCFADDLMVFVDGNKSSIEGAIQVFDEFTKKAGLRISLEKSTLYLAGVSEEKKDDIMARFPFSLGLLPVRYLGLPLVTKRLTKGDWEVLVERIRKKLQSWTARYLSYAGRFQLLTSVIASMVNFWLSAYRLPKSCLDEIEKLCAAFLWSGPDLNTKKAKVTWKDVCKTKEEGGLGFKSFIDVNKVSCLKLVWRIISNQPSLWVQWIKISLLRQRSFWLAKEKSSLGSWMWKKILKYRNLAKDFFQVKIGNGATTSFWFDKWCDLGSIHSIIGDRGYIDLGLFVDATVETAMNTLRLRSYRGNLLNQVEEEVFKLRRIRTDEKDIALWRDSKGRFKNRFSSKETWIQIRQVSPLVTWSKGIWFKYATPKFSFLLWVAALNRLSTADRMDKWNINASTRCILCSQADEDRNHLFFDCVYTSEIWKKLAKNLLGIQYSSSWIHIFHLITSQALDKLNIFMLRYLFQLTVHHVWRERNRRRHGEDSKTTTSLIRIIDKDMRNRLSTIRIAGDQAYDRSLSLWFSLR